MDQEIDQDYCQGKPSAMHLRHDRLLILDQMGKFSSDRALNEYAESYWNIEPCPVPSSA